MSVTKMAPSAPHATCCGLLNLAAGPTPSASPAAPPARVCTRFSVGSMTRMRWLLPSTTMMWPVRGQTATPQGPSNVASEQGPSLLPGAPVPAKVETSPPAVTWRIRLLSRSATYRLPPASRAIWPGPLNCAAVPWPSSDPRVPLPAKVATAPSAETVRITLLRASDTETEPSVDGAKPAGSLNWAAAPWPSRCPSTLPASVITSILVGSDPWAEAFTESECVLTV